MISTSSPEATRAIVIYHDNCCDGFGAAWAFYRLAASCYREGVTYVPCSYGQDLESELAMVDAASTDIYVLDFSFNRTVLTQLAASFAHVTVLDHHATAKETLTCWEGHPANLDLLFDMGRSGARISWEYFCDTPSSPQLIRYIEDRDLWRHEMPESKSINALIQFAKKTFTAYDALHNSFYMSYQHMVEQGKMLLEVQERHCASIIQATKRPINIAGFTGLACNCSGQFASDVGNLLALESGTFGATWYTASEGTTKFSLRSNGDYDVRSIAESFGGGGHKNAAGFTLPTSPESGVIFSVPSLLP